MCINRNTGEGDVKNDTVHGFLTCCYDDWIKETPLSRNLGFWQLSHSWRLVCLQIKLSSDVGEDSTKMTGQISMNYSTNRLHSFYIQDLQVSTIILKLNLLHPKSICQFSALSAVHFVVKSNPISVLFFFSHHLSTYSTM